MVTHSSKVISVALTPEVAFSVGQLLHSHTVLATLLATLLATRADTSDTWAFVGQLAVATTKCQRYMS